ncbi:hypothetical protein LOC68_16525 [Blastopirellula sp. JC732]|uniref:Uncharacterized protein n=1 Tax=Blastopirellula sediminis TaxID=2894196 RepID=A0A9X1SKP2_9BACT|nr:hypothetical protein [Blastopirellula sediminis]MCC9606704.1 hypothetical protein [Blastopirellula sediminis]MCC9629999.1 hypothetical protein [Blastopirellula sediminis]
MLVKHLAVVVGLTALGFVVPIAGDLRQSPWGDATAVYQVSPAEGLQVAFAETQSLVLGSREFALELRGETIDHWDDVAARRVEYLHHSEHGTLGLAIRWSLLMTAAYLGLQVLTLTFGLLSRTSYLANLAIVGGVAMFLTGAMPAAGLLAIAIGMILKMGQILDYFTTVKPAAEY